MDVIEDYNDIMKTYDPSKNRTKNIMSKYEKVKILGVRTEQLQRGSLPLITWDKKWNPREIAIEELIQRKTPFMICRKMPNGVKEYFKLEDMIIM